MKEISGIYGANIPQWSEDHWYLVGLGSFKWAVVRTDCNPDVAKTLYELGIEVILQMPDGFNQNPYQSPAAWARRCWCDAQKFKEFSDIICLDNEPNLCQVEHSPWYAEQFCRWYRAVLALWRFEDPGGRWKVLFPALSPTQHLHPEMWFNISEENVHESDALAAHSYWPGSILPGSPYQDEFHCMMHNLAPDKDIYILEYGSPSTICGDEAKAQSYNRFLKSLPDYVKCACAFILGGTPEWSDWFITEKIAQMLGVR